MSWAMPQRPRYHIHSNIRAAAAFLCDVSDYTTIVYCKQCIEDGHGGVVKKH